MKLMSEQENLILENRNIVHFILKEFGESQTSPNYEDLVSIGTIGLIKAAITYDASKKFAFITYATKCIKNEIFMYYRKIKPHKNDISIEEYAYCNDEGKGYTIEETFEDSESDFVEKMIINEDCINLISIILNSLKGKKRIVLLYRIGGLPQNDISVKLKISQSYVSRIEKNAINAVREIQSQPKCYKGIFSVAITEDEYIIDFLSKDICKSDKMKNQTSFEKIPNCKINYNDGRFIIRVPACTESFSLIAQIIQEIEDENV